jgi:hypothetical protein
MRRNVDLTRGLVFSSPLLQDLVAAGMLREKAYSLVQSNAMRAWEEDGDFRAIAMEADPEVRAVLTPERIAEAFSVERQLRNVDKIFARVFGLNIRIGPARHFSIILIHLLLTFLQAVFYISLVEIHAGKLGECDYLRLVLFIQGGRKVNLRPFGDFLQLIAGLTIVVDHLPGELLDRVTCGLLYCYRSEFDCGRAVQGSLYQELVVIVYIRRRFVREGRGI